MLTAKTLIRLGGCPEFRWAHMSFCWFCHEAAQILTSYQEKKVKFDNYSDCHGDCCLRNVSHSENRYIVISTCIYELMKVMKVCYYTTANNKAMK